MADLSITASEVSPVEVFEQVTLPTDEALNAGQVGRLDPTSGKATKANGTLAAEARALGVSITHVTVAGEKPATLVKRGILDLGDALDALDFDDQVFLSDTDGTLADTAGTVTAAIGRVVPGWGAETADKLLFVDVAL